MSTYGLASPFAGSAAIAYWPRHGHPNGRSTLFYSVPWAFSSCSRSASFYYETINLEDCFLLDRYISWRADDDVAAITFSNLAPRST